MRARTEPASWASASTSSAVTATKRPSHGRTTASRLLSRSKSPAPASSGPSATLVTTSRTNRPWHGTSAVSTYVAGEKPAPWRAETKTVQAPGSSVSAARRRTGMNSSVSGMSSSASGRCGPAPGVRDAQLARIARDCRGGGEAMLQPRRHDEARRPDDAAPAQHPETDDGTVGVARDGREELLRRLERPALRQAGEAAQLRLGRRRHERLVGEGGGPQQRAQHQDRPGRAGKHDDVATVGLRHPGNPTGNGIYDSAGSWRCTGHCSWR